MTIKRLRKEYTRLKARYYQEYIMPAARDITFRFLPEGARTETGHVMTETGVGKYGQSTRKTNKEGKVEIFVELHEKLKREQRLFYVVLLHEMSHLSNWRAECGSTEWWNKESLRLGAAGAMREFF